MSIVHIREFRVNARHIDRHHACVVRETSFEAAAVAYLDDYWQAPEDGPDVSIVVHELATGHEHCFQVDFDTGDVSPVGDMQGKLAIQQPVAAKSRTNRRKSR